MTNVSVARGSTIPHAVMNLHSYLQPLVQDELPRKPFERPGKPIILPTLSCGFQQAA